MFRLIIGLLETKFNRICMMSNQGPSQAGTTPTKNYGRRNRRQPPVQSFRNATTWPSNDHHVVKFEHSSPEPPFNISQLVSTVGGYFMKYKSQPSENGNFETKIEMKTAAEAERLWKHCQENLTWGVLSVEPDFFYTIKKTWNNQNKSQPGKSVFQEYWSEEKLKNAIENCEVITGPLRINAKKNIHAFISDPDGKDILIPSREDRNRALDGDIVVVEIKDPSEWESGNDSAMKTLEIETFKLTDLVKNVSLQEQSKPTSEPTSSNAILLKRKTGRVVGILEKIRSRIATGFLKIENMDEKKNQSFIQFQPCNHTFPYVCIPREFVQKEREKQDISKVIFACRITSWDHDKVWPVGELCNIVGEKGQIEPETQRILVDCDIEDSEFTTEVINCLPLSGQKWSISQEERAKRRDYTKECIFSIDPPHARDLDDALHCNVTPDGNFEIGVHIADVSHFVKPKTALDNVASARATSVYMVQRVIPMLPRLLCEELCSLNPDVERLAFSVVWTITKEGKILSEWFGRSIIRSCAKLSYDHAQAFIDGRANDENGVSIPSPTGGFTHKHLEEKILNLFTVSQNLRRQRMEKGALRLDQVRLNYTLNSESGNPNGCYTYEYKKSNELIEEFMLLANMAVAHQLYRKMPKFAFLRCHPPPKEDMLDDMVHQCRAIGLEIDAKTSQSLSRTIQTSCGDDELSKYRKMALFMLAIKPQKLAAYLCAGITEDPAGYHHYALNVPLYTHFTSPIRRYADLVVHRQLAATLGDNSDVDAMAATTDELELQAKLCNHRKANAKTAGDLSVQLFFGLFVKSFGPLESKGMVMGILDHCLDVLSMEYGVTKRVYMDAHPLLSFQYGQKDSPSGNQKLSTMKIKWPLVLTPESKLAGLEPTPYGCVGSNVSVEQSYEVFSVVDLIIKPDDHTTDGYKVSLRPPVDVSVIQ